MCGITGFFQYRGEPSGDTAGILKRMAGTIAHRGPDDDGFHLDGGVGLGFRRLSIVDLSGGHQPISNEDDSLWLTFNGEVYNHLELRPELEAKGHRYKTRSDAEAVLHAYEEWGEDCLQRLQGMFAFALHDGKRKRVFAARDRLGIKPLVYHDDGRTVVFGSEIKALLAHPSVPREADPDAAALYLTYRYLPAPHTLFRGIRKLPPGHFLSADANGVRVKQWWDVPRDAEPLTDRAQAEEMLRAIMDESVRARLMADVPVGALLSGGIDSSIIVALMARHHQGPVKTFSIGFRASEGTEAELPVARRFAEFVGTEHHELFIQEEDLLAQMEPMIWNMDEPLVEPAAIPVHLICRLARDHVVVALTGEGADELFAGYPKYGRDHLAARYHRLPRFVRDGVIRGGLDALPLPLRRVRVAERSLAITDASERWASWFAGFAGAGRARILDPGLRQRLADPTARGPIAQWLEGRNGRAADLNTMLYADVKTWLADDLLMKMDRMSMATSLEARVPFLDHRVVELAFRMPPEWKLSGGRGKAILRDAFADVLNPELLGRPKVGFPVPLARWFRDDLKPYALDMLFGEPLGKRGIVSPTEVKRVWDDHQSGRRDNWREIWTLVNLEAWYRIFIDPAGAPLNAPAPAGAAR